jgi:tetratricopeptide (TPR) repeat protein
MRPQTTPSLDDEAPTMMNERIGSAEAALTGAFQAELNRYILEDKLGAGGMAAVFRARDRITGDVVALKIIENGDDDPSRQARFEREVRSAGGLIHPNVCRVISFGRAPAKLFMAMELVLGSTLQRMIKARGTVPVPVALEALRQLLSALECAHAKGVVHRDLKPANVMITPDGMLKLLDFGIAKSQEDATVTATGLLIGTPAFMAPEQILGGGVDQRSDLFSAGVTFLVMLVGRTRFSGLDPASVMVKVTSEPVGSLLEECPVASTAVDRFLAKLCAQNVNDRFQTATEALDAMSRLEELPHHDEGCALLARYLVEPDAVAGDLARAGAASELLRADRLMKMGIPGYPAAALSLYRAALLDPAEDTRRRLAALCAEAALTFEPVEDAKIAEAYSAFEKTPNAPGVLKRLADLYRARGHVLYAAAFLTRYLRVKPNDSHAAQQLQVLLDGPSQQQQQQQSATATGSQKNPNTGTNERLRTRDIVAGIKTGGHVDPAVGRPGLRPLPGSTNVFQPNMDATQVLTHNTLAPIPPGPPQRPAGAAPSGVGPSGVQGTSAAGGGLAAQPTVLIAGRGLDRSGPSVHPLLLLIAAVVVAGLMLAFFGRFIRTTVDDVQLAVSENEQRVGRVEATNLERMRKNYLDEARGHLERGNYSSAVRQANQLMASSPPAEMGLEALWIRAQARLSLRDRRSARIDLEEYLSQSTLNDPRRAEAKRIVDAIYQEDARTRDPSYTPPSAAAAGAVDPTMPQPGGLF